MTNNHNHYSSTRVLILFVFEDYFQNPLCLLSNQNTLVLSLTFSKLETVFYVKHLSNVMYLFIYVA